MRYQILELSLKSSFVKMNPFIFGSTVIIFQIIMMSLLLFLLFLYVYDFSSVRCEFLRVYRYIIIYQGEGELYTLGL